jgi:acetyltransferase-like isoleucine patch superfamily enzyme
MDVNLFFDESSLGGRGSNVIIGKTVRIRYPELVFLGNNIIIDDFTYISTRLIVRDFAHISSGCKLIGGPDTEVLINSFSTLAPNVVLAAGSDDYTSGLATPMIPQLYKGSPDYGRITLGKHCIVGAHTTVLPNVELNDGVAIGANSLVKKSVPPWEVHCGTPTHYLKDRDKLAILKLESQFLSSLIQ